MFESLGAVSIFDFDDAMRNTIRGVPPRLIRETDAPPEVIALGRLDPPPAGLEDFDQVIGASSGGPERPDVVVTGICQGRGQREDKECWLKMGPTIEAVCILDCAHRIAASNQCPIEIWIPDQEYAYTVVDSRFTSNPAYEFQVGAKLAHWCKARYPSAIIRRTSEFLVRADVYSLVTDPRLAGLYPAGVPRPYNSSPPAFWQELQFLAAVASFLLVAVREEKRVWAVADHEQLRPMAAARDLADGRIKVLALWPCPRLHWLPPRRGEESAAVYAGKYVGQSKKGNRRMFRGESPEDMLFIDMTTDQIARHLTPKAYTAPICMDTLWEILRYLGVAVSSNHFRTTGEAVDALHAGLERLRRVS